MRVFLQDSYLNGFGWMAFKEGIITESLNLSLYFSKYINESALKDSTNKAKLFSVSLLKNYDLFENLIKNLIRDLQKLIKIVESYEQDNRKSNIKKINILELLKIVLNLVENGMIFEINIKDIEKLEKLYYQNYNNIKHSLDNLIISIKTNIGKIQKCNTFSISLPKNTLGEYTQFFNLQKSLWMSKIEEFDGNPDELIFTMKTKSRLVVGLGDESVYETSIRLHRNYGIPYIPGSALKGVAKHYAIYKLVEDNFDTLADKFGKSGFFELAGDVQKLFEKPNDDDVKEYNDLKLNSKEISLNDLRKIFGTQSYEGSVVFFDAFPTPEQFNRKPVLELDVMNPHYQPYYSASESDLNKTVEKAPGDWHSPNPVFFLTVPKGVEFQLAIAPRNEEAVKLLGKAKELLISALREHGVGAKTTLGYGRFE